MDKVSSEAFDKSRDNSSFLISSKKTFIFGFVPSVTSSPFVTRHSPLVSLSIFKFEIAKFTSSIFSFKISAIFFTLSGSPLKKSSASIFDFNSKSSFILYLDFLLLILQILRVYSL